jgi:hypothetical protein
MTTQKAVNSLISKSKDPKHTEMAEKKFKSIFKGDQCIQRGFKQSHK